MRIVWNETEKYFQAELIPGELWRDDKDSIQAVGFQTDGPPSWTWFTRKASVLNKLRDTPPQSGLAITEVALQRYNFLDQQERNKLELKKTYDKAKRAARKQSPDSEISGLHELVIPAKGYIDASDLPPIVSTWAFVRPEPPDACCIVCGDPLYWFPDYPDICMWCDKIDKNNT